MAKVLPIQESWAGGMRRDPGRHAVPKGAAWNLVDFLPNSGAAVQERGGFTNLGTGLFDGGATGISAIGYAPFVTGHQVIAITSTYAAYRIVGSTPSLISASGTAKAVGMPVFFDEKLVFPSFDGVAAPIYFDSGALGTAATAPAGRYAVAYKERLVLGGSIAEPTTLRFSDPEDPLTWDPLSFVRTTYPIKGLAALRNAILIFSDGFTERLRGTDPPPGTDDLRVEPLFEIGIVDARSIAMWGENVLWANTQGIFMTDGAAPEDLTLSVGLSRLWQMSLQNWTPSWRVAACYFRGFYIVSVMNGTSFVDCFVIDLQRRTGWRWSNLRSVMFAHQIGTADEMYVARADIPAVAMLGSAFTKSSTSKLDYGVTPVASLVETAFYGRGGPKRIRDLYVNFDLRADGDGPLLIASYITHPEATAYTALAPALSETTVSSRQRRHVRVAAQGVAFKFTRAQAAADFRLYELELDAQSQEPSRLG